MTGLAVMGVSTVAPLPLTDSPSSPPLQTGVPMTGLAVMGAQWRLSPEERRQLHRVYLPWAWRAGCRARDLVSVHYEHHLEVRRAWS